LDPNCHRLWHGAAPSLPASYAKAIDGSAIGPSTGPCARAALFKEPVIISDIAADPLAGDFRQLALAHGLRACWSTPILSSDGRVLGTFAIYSRQPRSPDRQDHRITGQFTHLAAVAIERKRAEDKLRRSESSLARAQRLSVTGSFSWHEASGEMTWSDETYRICEIDPAVKPTAEMTRDLIHPEDVALFRQMLVGGEKDFRFDCRLRLPGGSIKHLKVAANALRDDSGQVTEWVGAVQDVTECVKSEEALRASEHLARGQLEALKNSLDSLTQESGPDKFLEHVLRTITEQLDAHSSSVWRREDGNGLVSFQCAFEGGRLMSKSNASIAAISPSLPIQAIWPWPEVFESGKPSVLEDIRAGPVFPWREHLMAQGVITILIVPMAIAGQIDGVIGIRFTRKRIFRAEEMELAQALAHQAMLAMQLTRLSSQSRQAAVMAERNRMARDIHDTLAQGFTGVIVQLEAAADAKSQGLSREADDHLRRASELARDNLKEARRSVRALRPQALEDKNLCEALEDLSRKMTDGTTMRAKFTLQGQPRPLPAEWEGNILRIGQEVLTNALRHAHASEFKTELVFAPEEIRLELRDNGRGFDPDSKYDGFGLVGMRERVEGMGGQITLESANGAGTAILIALPLKNNLEAPES
jgi:signal transduction histidine kinase/PAS domain-containing protein